MITLMTPLQMAALFYPHRTAIVSDGQRLTYRSFYQQARRLAGILMTDYGLRSKMTVGILCRNHLVSALLIPALSRLGVHVRLLNTDIPAVQMADLLDDHYRLLIYDEEVKDRCLPAEMPCPSVSAEVLAGRMTQLADSHYSFPILHNCARISVLTGGSSGSYTTASRRMGALQYFSPFWTLLTDVHIHRYSSVLIALPFYHGFGLSALIVSLLVGKKICLHRHFDCNKVLSTIQEENVEVLPVVPAMLSRLLQCQESESKLQSIKCILCGGDRLEKEVADKTQKRLGQVLFNLYGTSEAGFLMLAKPADLVLENIIGRPIAGVKCGIRNPDNNGIGQLWVRSGWAMTSRKNQWQNTGDLVSRDEYGRYYHHGRTDRIVVCGGENVSLDHVEHIVCSHTSVYNAMAYSVASEEFGQEVHVRVELHPEMPSVSEKQLREWLYVRLSRAEMPHMITFGTITILSTGKRSREI